MAHFGLMIHQIHIIFDNNLVPLGDSFLHKRCY